MIVVDTNILLQNPNQLDKFENIVLLSPVLEEIDKHKSSANNQLAYESRRAIRKIKELEDKVNFDIAEEVELDGLDKHYADNKVIQYCLDNQLPLVTNDISMKYKAKAFGIEIVEVDEVDEEIERDYKGYKEVPMSPDEVKFVYENLDLNQWDLLTNEYLVVLDELTGDDIDAFKWDGKYLHRVNPKGFNTNAFGKFKPYDFYQKIALDSILNNDLTRLSGKAGSGKSLIALYTAWHLIERGKYDRLIVFTNPVKTRNAEALGFYKGTRTEKLLDSQIGIMLGSKFGDSMAVEMQISQGKLILLPFSDIRGFDTTGEQKSIIWVTEAQNLNKDLMKLGLQRIGDDSKVIIDGDPNTQVDMDAYRVDNGMIRMSEVFRDHDFYGEVELKRIYRGKIASLADHM